MDSIQEILVNQGIKAKKAARFLATASTNIKNEALHAMADSLEAGQAEILAANALDLEQGAQQGLTSALLERLTLNESRIHDMAQGLRDIAALPDPVGEMIDASRRPNGLDMSRIRTPIGVIGIIYESRPNVTADAAALCLKSGNAILLRGGEEALELQPGHCPSDLRRRPAMRDTGRSHPTGGQRGSGSGCFHDENA